MRNIVDNLPFGSTCELWLIICYLVPNVDYGFYFVIWIHMWIMVYILSFGFTCGLWFILCHLVPPLDYGSYIVIWIHMWIMVGIFPLGAHMWIVVDIVPFGSACGLWFIFFPLDPHTEYS